MAVRILIAEDEETLRRVIVEVLTDDGFDVTAAPNGETALELFRSNPFPVVVTDIVMGRMSGIELLHRVKVVDPDTVVVIMTSHASLDTATSALRDGAYDYLVKPFDDLDTISSVVNRAAEKSDLARSNRELIASLQQNTTQLTEVNSKLQELADRDGLTGVYNHRFFRRALDMELARAARNKRSFSILFMDLDHFKRYNDANGHLAGDELLRSFVAIVNEGCRATTTLARYGGEEFVVLLPDTPIVGARCYAERIVRSVAAHAFLGGEGQPGGRVTVSIGVATYPDDGVTAESLLVQADQALYRAKESGRNTVCA